jgi:hypothetical protein
LVDPWSSLLALFLFFLSFQFSYFLHSFYSVPNHLSCSILFFFLVGRIRRHEEQLNDGGGTGRGGSSGGSSGSMEETEMRRRGELGGAGTVRRDGQQWCGCRAAWVAAEFVGIGEEGRRA